MCSSDLEWTVIKENNTYKSGRLSHVGQFFFDEEINMVIDKVRNDPSFVLVSLKRSTILIYYPFYRRRCIRMS